MNSERRHHLSGLCNEIRGGKIPILPFAENSWQDWNLAPRKLNFVAKPSPQEKIAAIKLHLLEAVPVSELCDQLGIAPTLFYRWQKEFFENGHVVFDSSRKTKASADDKDAKIQQLQAKLHKKNAVMAESMRLSS